MASSSTSTFVMVLDINEYKDCFEEEKVYMVKRSIDPSTLAKVAAIIEKFLPENTPEKIYVVYRAMQYFLQYISSLNEMPPNVHYHMIACLTLTMKYRDSSFYMPRFLSGFDLEKIERMEVEIANAIEWRSYAFTPFYFMDVFSQCLSCPYKEHIANKLICEIQVRRSFINKRLSLLGLSALLASSTDPITVDADLNFEPVCIEANDLKECVKAMRAILEEESFKILNMRPNLKPFEFEIDWLREADTSELDLDRLCVNDGHGDISLMFKSANRNRIIQLNPSKTLERRLPIFDNVYMHRDELGMSYVMRLKLSEKSKVGEKELKLIENLNKWSTCDHPNIVRLEDLVTTDSHMFLMFKYWPFHLNQLGDFCRSANEKSSLSLVKKLMYQLLQGIDHYHQQLGAHSHIRPESILSDGMGNFQIACFCLDTNASKLRFGRHDTEHVTYRAPELLLGSFDREEKERTPADIWALGCLFGEMVTGAHLFKGANDHHRAMSIFSRLGTPTQADWSIGYAEAKKFERIEPKVAKDAFLPEKGMEALGDAEIELLQGMLNMNPNERFTAKQALAHSYFEDLEE